MDKDLRTLLGERVEDTPPGNCGSGCWGMHRRLWQAVHRVADDLAEQQGQSDPALWRKAASRTGFVPGLLPDTFPSTNRSTFQQVLELER